MERIETRESNMWFVLKAFAILSVITAHMSFSNEYFLAETIRNCLGQIGVVIFFISAGYFYSRKPGDSVDFWKKKSKTIILPWFVFSTLVFFVSKFLVGKPQNLVVDFVKNFFGMGTVYWYMTVLVLLLMMLKYIYMHEELLYLCIVISVTSVFLSAIKVIPQTAYFNQYLNVFNWVGIFALGILLRKKDSLKVLINAKAFVISAVGLVLSIVLAVLRGTEIKSYIDSFSLFLEMFGFIVFLNISNIIANVKLLQDVGKKSFFIYLMHIQVAGIINTRLPYNAMFFILRPFIALAVCYIIAVVFKLVLKTLKLDKFNYVFGLDR